MTGRIVMVVAGALLLSAALFGCGGRAALPVTSIAPAPSLKHACGHFAAPGRYQCYAIVRDGPPDFEARCNGAPPYCADDLQSAYGIVDAARSNGKGTVVAIVDAYGYPTVELDLRVYRTRMGLPPCSVASGCLRIVNQQGEAAPLPRSQFQDWRFETALDVDMVSAVCPNCTILLVQADSSRTKDLNAAVDTAVQLGASVVSNSYGGPETHANDAAYDHPGHVMVAGAGDSGAQPEQPCSFATVVCVGGTTLARANNARGWDEVAWGGTGSGCSRFVPKPAWQTDRGCTMRSESDVSAEADPSTPVAVYVTGGWVPMGGTSAATPIVAALFAMAGNAATIDAPAYVWQHGGTRAFNDVVRGSNPGRFHCDAAIEYLCQAQVGYDGPTGMGTANGLGGF